jgi:hypothetical protein
VGVVLVDTKTLLPRLTVLRVDLLILEILLGRMYALQLGVGVDFLNQQVLVVVQI